MVVIDMAGKTEFGKRYGVALDYDGSVMFEPPGPEKSGLTPLSPYNPATYLS